MAFRSEYIGKTFMQILKLRPSDVFDNAEGTVIIVRGEYTSDEDAKAHGWVVGDYYELTEDNIYGSAVIGMIRKIRMLLLLLILSVPAMNAQIIQKSGIPNINPVTNAAYIWHDTTGKQLFQFKRPRWYFIGRIISETAPTIETTTSGVTVNYSEGEWYKGSTGRYYRVQNGVWVSNDNVNLDSLVNVFFAQDIIGKKNFKDTILAEKGLKSAGLIDSKGVKSDGSSTIAAINANGVQKSATVTVTTNTTLDGTYNTIYANTTGGDITITLPSVNSNNTGWAYNIMKTSASNTLSIARPTGSTIKIVSNNFPIILKNNGVSWEIN